MEEVAVPIVSDATCEAASSSSVTFSNQLGECQTVSASYSGLISADMLCAGARGKDACQVSQLLVLWYYLVKNLKLSDIFN